jgi:hypothetical protein
MLIQSISWVLKIALNERGGGSADRGEKEKREITKTRAMRPLEKENKGKGTIKKSDTMLLSALCRIVMP